MSTAYAIQPSSGDPAFSPRVTREYLSAPTAREATIPRGGIVYAALTIILAALSLALDFGAIDAGVEQGATKYMEWCGAYGLTITLIWLYLLIRRLLAMLQQNR